MNTDNSKFYCDSCKREKSVEDFGDELVSIEDKRKVNICHTCLIEFFNAIDE